jgi:hypothetical protein
MGSKFSRSNSPQPTPLFCAKGPLPYIWPDLPPWFWLLVNYQAPEGEYYLRTYQARFQIFLVEGRHEYRGFAEDGYSRIDASYYFNFPTAPSILSGAIIAMEEDTDRPLELVFNNPEAPPFSMSGSQTVPSYKGGSFTFFLWG